MSKERIPAADFHQYLRGNSGCRLFCATRNPYHRIVSAYADKFNRCFKIFDRNRYYAAKFLQVFAGPSAWFTNKRANQFLLSQLPLRDFLFDLKRNGLDFDQHFMPQVNVLLPDQIAYDCLLKVEDLSEGLASLLPYRGLLNSSVLPGRLNSTNKNGSRGFNGSVRERRSGYLDGEMAAIVRELYASDFDYFGYSSESLYFI